jgi:hypothetical protein
VRIPCCIGACAVIGSEFLVETCRHIIGTLLNDDPVRLVVRNAQLVANEVVLDAGPRGDATVQRLDGKPGPLQQALDNEHGLLGTTAATPAANRLLTGTKKVVLSATIDAYPPAPEARMRRPSG